MSSTISGAPTEYYYKGADGERAERKWWMFAKPGEATEVYKHIWPLYDKMKNHQSFRSTNNLRFARLYSDMELLGLKAGQYSKVTDPNTYVKSRVTYNVIKSCVDSATAKIAKNKPRPFYLSERGSWIEQEKAKRLNQFILGMFEQIGNGSGEDRTMWGLGRQCFRDAAIFGTGAVNFFESGDSLKAERNLCEEIIVDETEGMYRKPRQIHRHRYVAREVLLDLYPKQAKNILALPSVNEAQRAYETVSDMVETLESWHLKSGEDADDGRHVITTPNCDLMVDEYIDEDFPFIIQRWNNRILGYYGQGLAEELMGIQLEINKLLRNIQIAQHLMSVPQIWLEYQSRTMKKQMNNEIGGVKYYLGRPPIAIVPQAMSAEVYQHLERLYQRAYEITGISVLSATSRKPAGLNSGVALREYKDTETERFSVQEAMYENWFIEASEMIRKRCRALAEKGKDPVVQFKDGTSMKTLRFSDVDVPDSKLVIMPWPTSLLPKEPAGRLEYVQELIQAGIYSKDEAIDLLDFPDTSKINRIKLGPRNVIIKTIETMVSENKFISPEPYFNLDFAGKYAQDVYSTGKADDMPEERLELLRRFMDEVERLKGLQAQQQQMMQPMALPEQQYQTGVPEAPPQAELLPNVPQAIGA